MKSNLRSIKLSHLEVLDSHGKILFYFKIYLFTESLNQVIRISNHSLLNEEKRNRLHLKEERKKELWTDPLLFLEHNGQQQQVRFLGFIRSFV